MHHLCNTFVDGGCKGEKEWLEPKLAESIAASSYHLRLSADIGKLVHASAKGLGEGVKLYGKGEGAKNLRPHLKKHYPEKLYLKLQRFDNGVRQYAKTQVDRSHSLARSLARARGAMRDYNRELAVESESRRINKIMIPPRRRQTGGARLVQQPADDGRLSQERALQEVEHLARQPLLHAHLPRGSQRVARARARDSMESPFRETNAVSYQCVPLVTSVRRVGVSIEHCRSRKLRKASLHRFETQLAHPPPPPPLSVR